MKFKKLAVLIIASTALGSGAYAATPGAYVGAGLGYSKLENFQDAKVQDNGTGFAGQLFVGYNFNPYIGLELGYRKFGDTTYQVEDYSFLTADYQLYAFSLVAKAYLPLGNENNGWNAYVLFGASQVYGSADVKYNSVKAGSTSNNALLPTGGLGISYSFHPKATASVEYSYTNGKDGNDDKIGIPAASLATLNIAYNFG